MKWIAIKGTVKCEYCGYISVHGYKYKDKVCYRCNKGFFRFKAYETWNLQLETKGEEFNEM